MINDSRVTFLNQPKDLIEPHRTERRNAMISHVEEYLNATSLFGDGKILVTFFGTGVTGLTSLVETADAKYVLKTHLYPDVPKGEDVFLKTWESIGVSVPHVYETGTIDSCPYILMGYIPAKALEHASEQELLEKNVPRQMGSVLRKIHSVPAKGFGPFTKDSVGQYETLEDWIGQNPWTKNQIEYMMKNNILPPDDFGSVESVIKILIEHVQINPQSVYCHWDLAPGNVLDTEPITVFDPIPIFNTPYLDIARSMMQTVAQGFTGPEVRQQFIDGYFSDEQLNEKLLYAALLFICHTKMPYWHRTNQENIIKDLRAYLKQYKVSLD